jgi:hypothetical protein
LLDFEHVYLSPYAHQNCYGVNTTLGIARVVCVLQQSSARSLFSVLRTRSSLVAIYFMAVILALTSPFVIGIPPFPETWREPAGGHTIALGSSEPLASETPAMRNEPETPKLLVESSRGPQGEPVPIGLKLRGQADGAVVIIRGLAPGMELSAGGAVAGDTWQLSARDLKYAWVAPPKDFVASADLLAELRLPNSQIADRQTIHLEWMRPPTNSQPELEREQIALPQEIEGRTPMAPAADQHVNDPNAVTTVMQVTPSDQLYRGREESKSARAHGKNNLHRSVSVGSQPGPSARPAVRDSV